MTNNHSENIIGLDIGDIKIGVARVHTIAKIPEPLQPFSNDEEFGSKLLDLLKSQQSSLVVVGLPRNMSGEETAQSTKIREFVDKIKAKLNGIDFVFVDESLSSVRADEFMKNLKTEVSQDSIAACYILQEYLTIKQ